MRIGTLSARTGVPVPRIKYYIREGILPRGVHTSERQALYRPEHERRLRLVRALVSVGGIPIEEARGILALVDEPEARLDEIVARAMYALPVPRRDVADERRGRAAERLDALLDRRGWAVDEAHPARAAVVEALAVLDEFGVDDPTELLDRYADAAETVAAADLAAVGNAGGPDAVLQRSVAGTAVGESLLGGMRRLAHEDAAVRRRRDDG